MKKKPTKSKRKKQGTIRIPDLKSFMKKCQPSEHVLNRAITRALKEVSQELLEEAGAPGSFAEASVTGFRSARKVDVTTMQDLEPSRPLCDPPGFGHRCAFNDHVHINVGADMHANPYIEVIIPGRVTPIITISHFKDWDMHVTKKGEALRKSVQPYPTPK